MVKENAFKLENSEPIGTIEQIEFKIPETPETDLGRQKRVIGGFGVSEFEKKRLEELEENWRETERLYRR